MKRALLVIGVILAALVVAGGLYYYEQTRPNKVVRGSSTREFVTTQAPQPKPVPRRAALTVAWPTYGYDLERTHVAPPDYRERPPFRVLWRLRTGWYIEFPPAVAYGRVYVAQLKGHLIAAWQTTGKVAWRDTFDGMCTAASPTVGGYVIYQPFVPAPCNYGPRNGRAAVVAIAPNGNVLWQYPVASESTTLYRDGVLYFGSWDHYLYALDVSGRRPRLLWRYLAGGELNSSPAYANGTIYIGGDDGRVYAVDARTGRQRWVASAFAHFGSREYFYATPTIAYGRVYIGNTDGTVYCFGAATGNLLWTQNAGTYVYTAAAVWHRTVYVGSYNGLVYALDAATGDVKWTYDSPGSIHGAPTVLDGLVYFSTCGTCGEHGSRYAKRGPRTTFALDGRTGRLVWTFPDGHYSPIVADLSRVYLVGDTSVYGLEPVRAAAAARPAPPPSRHARSPRR